MTPNEFKQVSIPYNTYNLKEINELIGYMKNSYNARHSFLPNDKIALSSLSDEELEKLTSIYLKLVNRRLKNNLSNN